MHDYNSVLISPLQQGLQYYSSNTNGPSTSVAQNSRDEFLTDPRVRCDNLASGYSMILLCPVCLSNQPQLRGLWLPGVCTFHWRWSQRKQDTSCSCLQSLLQLPVHSTFSGQVNPWLKPRQQATSPLEEQPKRMAESVDAKPH